MTDSGHIEEQVEARALRALPPQEELQVDEHVDQCPPCQELLAQAHDTANLLAFAARPAAPPRRCKMRVMELIERDRFLRQPTQRSVPGAWLRWAAAAAVFVGMFGWNMRLQRQLATDRRSQDIVFADPEPSALKALGQSSAAGARMYMAADGMDAVLVVHDLAPPPAGKVYQIWVADDKRQQPMETFEPSNRIDKVIMEAPVPLHTFKQVMITVEDAGGSTVPSETTVLLGDL